MCEGEIDSSGGPPVAAARGTLLADIGCQRPVASICCIDLLHRPVMSLREERAQKLLKGGHRARGLGARAHHRGRTKLATSSPRHAA